MEELIINKKNAYEEWGVRMGDGFLSSLGAYPALKSFIENKSRTEDGKRVIVSSPKIDERELTLSFTISGKTPEAYQKNKDGFENELRKGAVSVKVPKWRDDEYHLIYTGKSISYAESFSHNFGTLSCKFEEPNPNDRKTK